MTRRFTDEDRIRLLTGYADSPLTVRKYAKEKGIGYSTFQRWAFNHKISLRKKETPGTLGLEFLHAKGEQQSSATSVQFKDITADIVLKSSPARVAPESLSTGLSASSLLELDPSLLKMDDLRAGGGQLDIFLPKGVKMTFHQVPLTHSLALMKALL